MYLDPGRKIVQIKTGKLQGNCLSLQRSLNYMISPLQDIHLNVFPHFSLKIQLALLGYLKKVAYVAVART